MAISVLPKPGSSMIPAQRDYNKASAHYNEDAIFSALRAGLHDFICHHGPIFTTYKEVGQAFPAHYL